MPSTMQNLLVALISIPILLIARYFTFSIPYTNQGFFCDDDEIRYPDRPSTIGSHKMHVVYAAVIAIIVPLSEISLSLKHSRGILNRQVLLKTLFFYAAFICGVLATSVATNVFKRTSSRLRPNFIAVCKPKDLDQLCPMGSNAFIEDFECLGVSNADEHFSFPSGHSSHSLYFATFAILYLHRRFRFPNVVRGFVQFGIFLGAVYICLSRVRDFKHRYEDVAGGGLLGIVLGIGMVRLVVPGRKKLRRSQVQRELHQERERLRLLAFYESVYQFEDEEDEHYERGSDEILYREQLHGWYDMEQEEDEEEEEEEEEEEGPIRLVLFNFKHHRYEHHDHEHCSDEEKEFLVASKYQATSSFP